MSEYGEMLKILYGKDTEEKFVDDVNSGVKYWFVDSDGSLRFRFSDYMRDTKDMELQDNWDRTFGKKKPAEAGHDQSAVPVTVPVGKE